MKPNFNARWAAQAVMVLACAFGLKQYYSLASADQLKWILAPTTTIVEMVTGESFAFEPHSGYLSADHRFLIATSCAGVNFLITAFLMLSARKLLFDERKAGWLFIPASLLVAYAATLVANTLRIAVALQLQRRSLRIGSFDPNQIHRLEGIVVYFLSLSLLFLISERLSGKKRFSVLQRSVLPLLVYYTTMLGIPLANGAHNRGVEFLEYAMVVALVPLMITAIAFAFATWRKRFRTTVSGST